MIPARWKDLFEGIAFVTVIASLIVIILELQQTQTELEAGAYRARALDTI